MEKMHFSILIDAPKERVWDTMLMDDSYREWTDVFSPGSHYKGNWNKGSRIHFLAPGPDGKMGGMVSRIAEAKEYDFISIEHLGMVQDGKEDTESDAVKIWAGAHENYTFKEKDGKTELLIEADTNEEYRKMFEEMWPKALQKLKKLAENKY